ncbi:aminopeptidase P family protein [Caldimonas thermodepolymerans]|uniref:Xaa-Pro aminopeptidase n=1 Tax=Caldimonas thermodepolymerans TaxID=215580 RepID=A0A2S5T3S9_9BURK|nr:aminopeptidase P family protein [Caldimonas thermodepolymerans]PPE69640.1 Xaa-Pro aminopeptidase [Caldimonas thermodepolymerans]QPC31950.1 aminopeptidase P family protein [Caldimonas thermodepolymerans]RDI01530.1 Xaa-Pro aminopeptidase [Caldimonas thermodepolymerans]TCP05022.1 Xaa-Pro aminopeptidase [Caldimonas thermodepolymerans]UZG44739.1 aminopeptidase P family protein [Caldimonas thermodepolymerans]
MNTPDSRLPAVRERLGALRAAMQRHRLAAWLVPSADPHLSEYLPERWKSREWLSGFTGSMGTLVVTPTDARLFADSRYWVQAEAQLSGTGIALEKIPSGQSLAHIDWLAQHVPAGEVVGVDGQVLALAAARALREALQARGVQLRSDLDLMDEVWPDRPGLPDAPVTEHRPPEATRPRADKLAGLRATMRERGAQWHWISTLDDIAWLFNLRGADVPYNPVFVAHALIGLDSATLFLPEAKVPAALREALARDGVDIAPYEQARVRLLQLRGSLLLDPRRVTLGLREALPGDVQVIEAVNPTTLAKARKSAAEAAHIRTTMANDGAALAEFFAAFEQALQRGARLTELDVDEQITAARARRPGFVCPSFATIAGFNANGAMPHYRATPESHAVIEGHGLLLIDSGGQYLGGTTDITRVVPIGTPSAEQRRDFTLVLKAMMALSRARFPRGIRSPLLDAIARAPLWEHGLDYGHGTGHGVGYFLNVHEGPQVISYHAAPEPHTAMEPGMVTSIEPGLYRPGQWGVRIENLAMNVPAGETGFGEYLAFETLTLCPIDTRCIELRLLRDDELAWLNAYHATVRERVAPLVQGDALAWLEARTQPLGR